MVCLAIVFFSDRISKLTYLIRMRFKIFSFVFVAFTGLASYAVLNNLATPDNTQNFASLEQNAFQIITYHCGSCHTPGLKTSNPRALNVYDLSNGKKWWRKMTPSKLLKSRTMLSNRTSETKAELEENFWGSKYKARPPTADELRSYSNFVDAALLLL